MSYPYTVLYLDAMHAKQRLVHRLAYNDDVTAGQLAAFQGGPIRNAGRSAHIFWIDTGRASKAIARDYTTTQRLGRTQ
jgi:hypothetical protein